jgi:hypothetical protein
MFLFTDIESSNPNFITFKSSNGVCHYFKTRQYFMTKTSVEDLMDVAISVKKVTDAMTSIKNLMGMP